MDIKRIFEKHPHWQAIVETVQKIAAHGFTVYLAGGCVRDGIMGRTPHDFDVASSATPDEIKKMYPEALDIGRAFGVMILPRKGFQIEVTTFRKDGSYLDGRHPESVEFSEPERDAQRRDFTINGLFYDPSQDKVIDYVEGAVDIKNRSIRAIGDPYARFSEDRLRMLRAARFSAQLDFDIENKTKQAILKLNSEITHVSKERITEEFKKLSRSQNVAKGFYVLYETKLFEALFPSLNFINTDYWPLFLRSLTELSHINSIEILISDLLLFEGLSRDMTCAEVKTQLEYLPFILSRDSKREIEFLVNGFFVIREGHDEGLLQLNEESGPLLTELCFVFSTLKLFPQDNVGALIDQFLKVADERGHLPKAFLTGQDALKLGIQPSSLMGELLRNVYMRQIKGEIKSKEQALAWMSEQREY